MLFSLSVQYLNIFISHYYLFIRLHLSQRSKAMRGLLVTFFEADKIHRTLLSSSGCVCIRMH